MTAFYLRNILILALISQCLPTNTASAAGLPQFVERSAQSAKAWFSRTFGRASGSSVNGATDSQSARVIEKLGEAKVDRSFREILRHTDELERLTTGALRDIYGRIRSGHYVRTLGRGKVIDKSIVVLDDPMKDILAIEGSFGSGKDQVLIGIQERILSGEIPESLVGNRVVQINTSHVYSGDLTKLENQFNLLTNEYARDFKGNYIISLSDISYFLTDESLKKQLFDHVIQSIYHKFGKDKVKIIIAGSPSDVRKLAAASPSAKRMGKVSLEALTHSEVIELGMNIAERLKREAEFTIERPVVELAAQLSDRYLGHIGNPKSMVSLLLGAQSYRKMMIAAKESPLSQHLRTLIADLEEELKRAKGLSGAFAQQRVTELPVAIDGLKKEVAALDQRFNSLKEAQTRTKEIEDIISGKIKQGAGKQKSPSELQTELRELNKVINQVTPDELALWINMETGAPIEEILKKEWTVKDVIAQLKKKFYGQEDAAAAAIRAAERAKAIYRTSERPFMSLLFVGPPGTGKTELSKLLTAYLGELFAASGSEYLERHAVSKLIGAPPGYVGFDKLEPGALISFIKEKKRGGLLFDEVDQFHPDILKLLYQILDEGKVAGSDTLPVSLRNFFIFLTTNVGQDEITQGMSQGQMKEILFRLSDGALTKAILDRIDMIIRFDKLDKETYAKILGKQLEILNSAMAKEVRAMRITQEARDELLKPFLSGEVSARGIQRYFEENVTEVVNRIRSSGIFKNKAGVEEKIEFADGDMLEMAYSEARGIYFQVVR